MIIRLLAAIALFLSLHMPAQAKRIALVIGNANYSELPNLQKTHGDADGYQEVLAELGFDVTHRTDLDFFSTAQVVGDFIGRIQPGDEVAFVFAGHGWSDGRTNYLLPTNAPKSASDTVLAQLSLPLKNGASGILDQITARGASLNFSVIDACRDNPFIRSDGTRSAGLARGGLTGVAASAGSFVVYSAGEGQTALDRLSNTDTNRYSVFSRVFIPKLRSGISLEQAANDTQQEVSSLAATIGHRQEPAYYDQALGNTILVTASLSRIAVTPNPVPPSPAPPAVITADSAKRAYDAAKIVGTLGAYQAVIDRYPGTFWASLASEEIGKLSETTLLPPPPADPCRDFRGVPPVNARCVVENGGAVWISTVPNPAPTPRPSSAYGISSSQWISGTPSEAGSVFREFSDGPEMVVIPAGSFMMGSPSGEEGRDEDEGPQRRITVPRAFALGRYEATFAEWDACAGAGYCHAVPSGGDGDQGWGRGSRPVIAVSWDDTRRFTDWLNSRVSGSPYRLPSEAEWEYGVRAGTVTPFSTGGTISTDEANYSGNFAYGLGRRGAYREKTVPVGSFQPNSFGLYDVHGNVEEWVEDCYSPALPPGASARSQPGCSQRVLRGGSWNNFPRSLRSADRTRGGSDDRYGIAGFRVARTLTP